MILKLSKIDEHFTDNMLYKDIIPFDVIITGTEGRRVRYTHGSVEHGKYQPKFLAFIKNECQDFYIVGCFNCKKWLKTGKI